MTKKDKVILLSAGLAVWLFATAVMGGSAILIIGLITGCWVWQPLSLAALMAGLCVALGTRDVWRERQATAAVNMVEIATARLKAVGKGIR